MSSNSQQESRFLPAHGGALKAAANHFNIPLEQWLDLSTGINPSTWPVPVIPVSVWQKLPEDTPPNGLDVSIEQLALEYYLTAEKPSSASITSANIMPCAGSQQGIRLLPLLYNALQKKAKQGLKIQTEAKVWVTSGSYSEHGLAWEEQGHRVRKVACDRISQLLTQQPVDVLILVNPDNPSGHRWKPEQLLKWWSILNRRGGWLIVDEAFMDMTPEQSLISQVERDGLFVLRSMGKFFGLAGIRLGFIFAAGKSVRRLNKMLGPWALNHPAQYIGKLALQDQSWVEQQKYELSDQAKYLSALLNKYLPFDMKGTDLFRTVYFNQAEQVFYQLAKQGILTRYLPATSKTQSAIRFGLPPNEPVHWQQLEIALAQIKFSQS